MKRQDQRLDSITRRQWLGLAAGGTALGLCERLIGSPALLAAQGAAPQARVSLPPGSVIRSITKDIDPKTLGSGVTLIHEHPASAARDDLNLLVTELQQAQKDGLACIVDASTGRRTPAQVEYVKQASIKSGVPIVLGGSYYLQPSYPKEIATMSEDQLYEHLVQDARGQNWGALGEFGTSPQMHADERKMLRAAGRAQVTTGLPLFTHTPHSSCPSCAIEQLDILESVGVDPRHLIIGHLSAIKDEDDPTSETHKKIAKRGAFVGLDTMGHEMTQSFIPEARKVKLVQRLLDAGLENQIIFGSDFANATHLKSNWGMGFMTVVTQFGPKLRYAGVKEETIRKITVENSRRFLAYVPKKTA
jgi:phosphotriesterase-related protein